MIYKNTRNIFITLLFTVALHKSYSMEQNNSLHKATKQGNLELVKFLLDSGVSVNAQAHHKWISRDYAMGYYKYDTYKYEDGSKYGAETALHLAAQYGHTKIAELLLEYNADTNIKDSGQRTALHYAAARGYRELAELLVDNGADLNIQDGSGKTALHEAAEHGYTEIARLLINNKADSNAPCKEGWTPLHHAAVGNHKEIVELLLNNNADVDIRNASYEPVLHLAQTKEIARLLISRGAAINTQPCNNNRTVLLKAVGCDRNRELVRWLVAQGADVNAQNGWGSTALHEAGRHNNIKVAQLLINNGADIHAVRDDINQPNGHNYGKRWYQIYSEIIPTAEFRALLESYAALEQELHNNPTLETLNKAVNLGHVYTTKELIKQGFSCNRTHLETAIAHNHTGIVKLLIQSGVTPKPADLKLAEQHKAQEVGRMLVLYLGITGPQLGISTTGIQSATDSVNIPEELLKEIWLYSITDL
jgi:ankyrin repeat protein